MAVRADAQKGRRIVTRRLSYVLLDVFTDHRFSGNPLAVVLDADALADDEMQKIAREFNLSETVFLRAPRDAANSARARIFTPQRELPFAGHPTIGAAGLLAERRAPEHLARHGVVIALEEEIGLLRCDAHRGRDGITYVEFAAPAQPLPCGPAPICEMLAAALSLDIDDIGFDAHAPSFFSAGAPFVFVPLRSREALNRARRAAPQFETAMTGALGAFLYAKDTIDPANAIHARVLANGLGFDEDPATGSAVVAFAGVAMAFERPDDGAHQLFIEQGYAMGRPSRLTLRMRVENGALVQTILGGQMTRVAEGTLFL